jgi:hypothetical protein
LLLGSFKSLKIYDKKKKGKFCFEKKQVEGDRNLQKEGAKYELLFCK